MGGWNIEICDCIRNPTMFLFALCVPGGMCYMQSVAAWVAEEKKSACRNACLLSCFLCTIGSIINRSHLRKSLEIKDSILFDICYWCCVPCCAVTQEFMQTMDYKREGERNMSICRVWTTLPHN